MVLAGKAAIDGDIASASGADLTAREMEGFTEQDPQAAGAASFAVTAEHIHEVLGTALFIDLGSARLAFAHRSLAEYMSARYLIRHDMDVEQVMQLLASADDPDGRLLPQLREVAAWTATFDEEVLSEVMGREPELLLRADNISLPENARSALVASLLDDEPAMRVDRYDRRMRQSFGQLVHPGLADQIRDAMRPGRSIPVRQMAFTLAQAAALPELQHDLVAFAFDSSEPAYLRDDAVWALKDYADQQTRRALVPLATERVEDDSDDEIKGQALAATFPSLLGVQEVLAVLSPARNEHLLGAYKMFVSRDFPQALDKAGLVEALKWAQTVDRDHGATDLLSTLTDDVIAAAWSHIDDAEVCACVAALVKARLIAHHELLGPLHDSDDQATFREDHGRRLLITELVDAVVAGEVDARSMTWSDPPLALSADFQWAADRLRTATGEPTQVAWAALASAVFVPETCDVDEFFKLADENSDFEESTKGWRIAVDLESDTAKFHADQAGRRKGAEPPADAPDMDDEIRKELDAVEAGDADAWWRLNLALIYDKHGSRSKVSEIEADITRLPGWERSDADQRDRIIDAARRYLDRSPADPEEWIEKNTVNRPAFSGYRALHLLASHRPVDLDTLDDQAWVRWMPIIVGYPRSSGIDDERYDNIVVGIAAYRAPVVITEWVIRTIDMQNVKGDGHLFVLSRLRRLGTTELVEALTDKLTEPGLTPNARGGIADWGMRADPDTFLPRISQLLAPGPLSVDRDGAVAVATAAWSQAPGRAWSAIGASLRADVQLGKAVFEEVAYGERSELAAELSDGELRGLVDWLFEMFPPAEDPALEAGAGYVTRRNQAGQTRDQLLAVLATRGTDRAVEAIDDLAIKYPSYGMTRRKADAREARLARWTAPEARHVISLAQNNDARIVLSDRHLRDVIMGALRRVERRLQDTTPPSARELWSTHGKPRPKTEEELSTCLAGRIREDLQIGGRVVGRELEVRPNQTGRGRGESADLSVFAPVGAHVEGAGTASVTIEVKGCWHRDVRTAMKNQLVERYLTGATTTHGIYLVLWFASENWDPKDSRRSKCVKDPQRLHDFLLDQARELTTTTHASVRAFVMDGSLPPARGPARRLSRFERRLLP